MSQRQRKGKTGRGTTAGKAINEISRKVRIEGRTDRMVALASLPP